jgi:hypothetical protein
VGAGGGALHLDLGGHAGRSVLEADAEVGLYVGAAGRAAPRARAKDVTDSTKSPEEVGEVFHPHLLATKTAAASAVSGVPAGFHQTPHLVIFLALLHVGQGGVSLRDLFELLFGLVVPRVGVGVISLSQLAIGLLYLFGGGFRADTEDLVEVLVDPVPVHRSDSSATRAARSSFPLSR